MEIESLNKMFETCKEIYYVCCEEHRQVLQKQNFISEQLRKSNNLLGIIAMELEKMELMKND